MVSNKGTSGSIEENIFTTYILLLRYKELFLISSLVLFFKDLFCSKFIERRLSLTNKKILHCYFYGNGFAYLAYFHDLFETIAAQTQRTAKRKLKP